MKSPQQNRRALLRALLVAVPGLLGACTPKTTARLTESRPLMGTMVEIAVEGEEDAALRPAVDAAYREMGRLTDMMSHYDSRSVVSAIGAAAARHPVQVPPELMTVLKMARHVSERTHGAFDVTVGSLQGWRFDPQHPRMPTPRQIAADLLNVDYRRLVLDEAAGTSFLQEPGMRLDLGGIAKLYILHAGMEVLQRHGVCNAMINSGGDVQVIGGAAGQPWRIGVRDPRAPRALLGAIELEQGFVISSGDYERYFVKDGRRYHHILDPRTGYPAEGPRGVTLLAKELTKANGLSAAVMVLGKEAGIRLIRETPGIEGLIVDRDGSIWTSAGFRARLRPVPRDLMPG